MDVRRLGVTAALLGVGGAGPVMASAQEIDAAAFAEIREPRITERPPETVIEVRATGDPNVVGGQAFGLLFQLYFSSPQTPKTPPPPVPRARWPSPPGTPPEEWVGLYALPVPDETVLPGGPSPAGLEARVTSWEYGLVAEVLYEGPYDREQPTLDALREFAVAEGYDLLPGHEEEYLRGPTMAGPGNPAEYLTILRYRLRPRGSGR